MTHKPRKGGPPAWPAERSDNRISPEAGKLLRKGDAGFPSTTPMRPRPDSRRGWADPADRENGVEPVAACLPISGYRHNGAALKRLRSLWGLCGSVVSVTQSPRGTRNACTPGCASHPGQNTKVCAPRGSVTRTMVRKCNHRWCTLNQISNLKVSFRDIVSALNKQSVYICQALRVVHAPTQRGVRETKSILRRAWYG